MRSILFVAVGALHLAFSPGAYADDDEVFRFLGSDLNDPLLQAQVRRDLIETLGDDYGLSFRRNGGFRVSGPYREDELDEALAFVSTRLEELQFRRCRDNVCQLDLPRILRATERGRAFGTITKRFKGNERERAEAIVNFVQNIPYRVPPQTGFLPPRKVLTRNYGDCDSKSVLAAALLRSSNVGRSVVFLTYADHVNIGIEIEPEPGDLSFTLSGRTYVLAEVAGPGEWPIGETDEDGEQQFFEGNPEGFVADF
ncbi:MAG: transglutaminase-like domain-containing protein [Pseudomonadota bacterium]